MKLVLALVAVVLLQGTAMADDDADVWNRPHFKDVGEKPHVFYVVFGANAKAMKLSKEKHNLTGVPKGLRIRSFDKTQHAEYINSFLTGALRGRLKNQPALEEKVLATDKCAIVEGTIEVSDTLEYLRNTIGIVQGLTETNGVAVLDLHAISWHDSAAWSRKFFEPRMPQPLNHVLILSSEENGGTWLHTRGMRKFGRPDISILKIDNKSLKRGKRVIERYITHFALGASVKDGEQIKMREAPRGLSFALKGDYDNLDFNNYYVEVTWK